MNHAVSTHYFINHRLTTAALSRIHEAGIPAVEIFCARQHLDYLDPAQIQELGHFFRDSSLRFHSLHSPMYSDDCWGRTGPGAVINLCELTKPKRVIAVDHVKRALEIAENVPFRFLIQHIGVGGEDYDEFKVEAAFTSLEELSVFARQRGVNILLENIPNALSSAERLLSFLQQTHLDLNFCFDTGHANIMNSVESEFELMRPRIRSLHVHDNDGTKDNHLFPTLTEGGTVDWRKAVPMLRAHEHQFPLLLELKESPEFPQPLDAIQRVFDNLESY